MWKPKNEDEEDVLIRSAGAASHEKMFALLLVCAWTRDYREAKAVDEGRLQNLKEIISDEISENKYNKKIS